MSASCVPYRLCLQSFSGDIASNQVVSMGLDGSPKFGCGGVEASRWFPVLPLISSQKREPMGSWMGDLDIVSRFETSTPFSRVGFGCPL
jgi:hypothetical protein